MKQKVNKIKQEIEPSLLKVGEYTHRVYDGKRKHFCRKKLKKGQIYWTIRIKENVYFDTDSNFEALVLSHHANQLLKFINVKKTN